MSRAEFVTKVGFPLLCFSLGLWQEKGTRDSQPLWCPENVAPPHASLADHSSKPFLPPVLLSLSLLGPQAQRLPSILHLVPHFPFPSLCLVRSWSCPLDTQHSPGDSLLSGSPLPSHGHLREWGPEGQKGSLPFLAAPLASI